MKDAKLIVVETDRLNPQSRHSTGSENKSFPFECPANEPKQRAGSSSGL